jgi:hypothetical protein
VPTSYLADRGAIGRVNIEPRGEFARLTAPFNRNDKTGLDSLHNSLARALVHIVQQFDVIRTPQYVERFNIPSRQDILGSEFTFS